MTDSRKQKLIDLGAEALAEGILSLATRDEWVDELINKLTSTPKENVQRFRKKLSRLKSSGEFYDWRTSSFLAQELELLLQDLKAGVEDPLTGIELVAEFIESDSAICEKCDDSNGRICNVFYAAAGLFSDYASQCSDKDKVTEILLRLTQKDEYYARNTLINCAVECLPEENIRTLIARIQERIDDENQEFNKTYNQHLIESLARQLMDARLYEENCIAMRGKLSADALIDLARICLENGDVEAARSRLKEIPEEETCYAAKRDKLLDEINQKQADSESLKTS